MSTTMRPTLVANPATLCNDQDIPRCTWLYSAQLAGSLCTALNTCQTEAPSKRPDTSAALIIGSEALIVSANEAEAAEP